MTELNYFNPMLQKISTILQETIISLTTPRFALLDFPDHANVGDSAIWVGELQLFRMLTGKDPAYVSAFHNLDASALRAAVPDGTIFLHGGGNFGDIWNHHQDFREAVLTRFRDRRIVQMPQSIHYDDPQRIARTARAIADHPDFTLLVRDEPSLELARRHFECPVYLCPDSALAIGATRPGTPTLDVIAMLRTDKEGAAGGTMSLPGLRVEDWLSEDAGAVRRAKAAAMLRAWATLTPSTARVRAYEAAAWHRVARGFRQLSQGRAIVTDRLHVHILAMLLGRPHAVLDNFYGKIGRFMDAFTGGSSLVHRASDLEDAVAWARGVGSIREAA